MRHACNMAASLGSDPMRWSNHEIYEMEPPHMIPIELHHIPSHGSEACSMLALVELSPYPAKIITSQMTLRRPLAVSPLARSWPLLRSDRACARRLYRLPLAIADWMKLSTGYIVTRAIRMLCTSPWCILLHITDWQRFCIGQKVSRRIEPDALPTERETMDSLQVGGVCYLNRCSGSVPAIYLGLAQGGQPC